MTAALGEQPLSHLTRLPLLVDKGVEAAVSFLGAGTRCVLVCTAGHHLTQAIMEEVVTRVPGGLDSFGPGRLVEACLKERSAPYGNLWESVLLVKVDDPICVFQLFAFLSTPTIVDCWRLS